MRQSVCSVRCRLRQASRCLRPALDADRSRSRGEIADIGDSSLSTPYTAWALAARHRQRAFVFWTYVIALAEDPLVRRAAEDLAREALSDGNLLRHERRLAWRAERKIGTEDVTTDDGMDESGSAALLESLLFKDMMAWSQGLDAAQREQLFAHIGSIESLN